MSDITTIVDQVGRTVIGVEVKSTKDVLVLNNPVIIQTPKCKTKNGIHKTAKQIYCDLVMNRDHQTFLDWIEKFQERVRNLNLRKESIS